MFFKKKTKVNSDNVYTVINAELDRLHKFMNNSVHSNQNNAQLAFDQILEYKKAILKALEKQSLHADEIKDLQDTVTDLILLNDKK